MKLLLSSFSGNIYIAGQQKKNLFALYLLNESLFVGEKLLAVSSNLLLGFNYKCNYLSV